MNGAFPLSVTHIELREHPEWHGMTTLRHLAADENGEPIYDDPAEAGVVPLETIGLDASVA